MHGVGILGLGAWLNKETVDFLPVYLSSLSVANSVPVVVWESMKKRSILIISPSSTSLHFAASHDWDWRQA